MKIEFSLRDHLYRRGYVYLAIGVASVIAFNYAVTIKTALKSYEQFGWFISCNEVNYQKLKEFSKEHVDEKIKEVTCRYLSSDSSMFSDVYNSYGIVSADVLILDEDTVSKVSMSKFQPLEDDNKYYGSTNYIDAETNSHYGILVHNDVISAFNDYISYETDKDYYLFLNKSSSHLNGFKDNSVTNSIYSILEASL